MALSFRHFFPEVAAAKQTLAAARQSVTPTRRAKSTRMLLYALTITVGAWLGFLVVDLELVLPSDKDTWRAGMTAVAVLSGFMIATMVFTGKVEAAKSLSIPELRDVTAKSTHLLLFQFGTLINHLACIFAMFLTPLIAARFPGLGDSFSIGAIALFFASIVRSVFIPLQIIELHRFTHAALLREKREEAIKGSSGM